MGAYKYEEFRQASSPRDGFLSKPGRAMGKRMVNFLEKAAQALEQQEENKKLAEGIRKYEQAVNDVSLPFNPQNMRPITNGLKVLEGFEDFLDESDDSGIRNYEKIYGALRSQGEPAEQFKDDLAYLSYVTGLLLDVDGLEAARIRHEKRAAEQAKQKEQPKEAPENAPQSNPQPQAGKGQPAPPQAGGGQPPKAGNAQPVPPQAGEGQPPKAKEPDLNSDDYGLEVDNLNINDLFGIQMPYENKVVEEKVQTADFEECKVPGEDDPSVGAAFDRYMKESERQIGSQSFFYQESPVAMAVDEFGKVFEKPEQIKAELNKPGRRLFVFRKDGSAPTAFENRNGKLFAAKDISAYNQLPGKEPFEPKNSLKATDIAEIPSYKAIKQLENKHDNIGVSIKVKDRQIIKAQQELKEAMDWNDSGELSHRVMEKPKEPKGFGTKAWRVAVKIFTLGFGETQTYREYNRRLRRWKADDKRYAKDLVEVPKKIKKLNEQKKEYENQARQISREKQKLLDEYKLADPDGKKKEIQDYQNKTEIRMAGVADIIKNGIVTGENVFANTWMKKAACQGKKANDPEAVRALKEYIVSRTVEEKTLEQTIYDKEFAAARNQRMVEVINNGDGMAQIEKDNIVKEMLEEQGDRPIDPDKFYETYKERSQQRTAERNHPYNKLVAEREALIKTFGEKPITKDSLTDVVRLNMLNKYIDEAKALPTDPDEVSKNDSDTFRVYLANTYRKSGLNVYTTPEIKQAMDTLSGAAANQGKKFTLDKMAEMVNEEAKKLELQKKAGGPQAVV